MMKDPLTFRQIKQHTAVKFYRRVLLATMLFVLLGLSLAACGGQSGPDQSSIQGEVFIPPTPAVTNTPPLVTPSPTPPAAEAFRPSPTPACSNSLTYLEDLSIPDGTLVNPGESLDKRWLVENSGSCNWDASYALQLVAGPELDVPETQALYPARSGSTATIRIIFTAPSEPNTYRSAWQAYNPQGEAFGDPIFIEVTVVNP
jgi:Ig-like domain from next to BRCA1 gene